MSRDAGSQFGLREAEMGGTDLSDQLVRVVGVLQKGMATEVEEVQDLWGVGCVRYRP